ncbi:MAG: PilC/PilY family type IV pilus protein [Pseudomonadota bacterium]
MKRAATLLLLSISVGTYADDTEIFRTTATVTATERPKVLIIFDDSGSMDTEVAGQRPAYDASGTYASVHDSTRTYWSTDGTPPASDTTQYVDASQNRCAESVGPLSNQGFFLSSARRWVDSREDEICELVCPDGYRFVLFNDSRCVRLFNPLDRIDAQSVCEPVAVPGTWAALSDSVNTPTHLECQADVINANSSNGSSVGSGYPKNNVDNADAFSASTPDASDVDWGTESYSFYSAHYMDWWYDSSLAVNRTRMAIAREVISELISANTSVDFGLATFNNNNDSSEHGGRIVQRIIEDMSAQDRANAVDIVENQLDDAGWTPLCETTYEVYRYLTGDTVLYGDDKNSDDAPSRDTQAESGGSYLSPTSDCSYVYVILMTDGTPTRDLAANSAIETLTGETCSNWDDGEDGIATSKNCLPQLAYYMATNDLDNDASNGNQFGITYTVGFQTSQPLLSETASRGSGVYYEANSADELANAFQGAILSILSSESTFTSPAVAVNTFNRTQSLDDVYYTMFKPNERVDWRGNVKKLRLATANDGTRFIADSGGVAAIDPATGYIKDSASTYWSSNDGGAVEEGGVGELLAARDPATRSILTNTGTNGALQAFTSANIIPSAFGLTTNEELHAVFGVSNADALTTVINYGQGYGINADGSSTGSARDWVMGDVLHSQPLVVNYGALGSATSSDPDTRIVVGTNGGFVHMFDSADGTEDWAFFPKELAPLLNRRRIDALSNDHAYGMDLTPVLYKLDANGDGTIKASDGDKAYVFLGMRRGGRYLYALDVTTPGTPTFLWMKSPADAGMSELAYTFSQPLVTLIPGYNDNSGVPKPVVIVGAGYDLAKDGTGVAVADSMGRGLFVLDAVTGALVRSVTPAAASLTNLQGTGLIHSVAGEVASLDSNGDGLTDRLYFADTGGNVWRVDLGFELPTSLSTETWYLTQLADLSGGLAATDRRFFNKPDIVRIRVEGAAVDAVLLGSGDRTNPIATDVANNFYVLRDVQTQIYTSAAPSSAECNDSTALTRDFRCALPITESSLFDLTSDVLNTGTEAEQTVARAALNSALGTKLSLAGAGEKSLSDSITLDGTVLFSTFTPASDASITSSNSCEATSGDGKLYFMDLYNGAVETVVLGPIIPGTPPVHGNSVKELSIVTTPGKPPSSGGDSAGAPPCADGVCDLQKRIPSPYGNYWYRGEY